MILLAFGSVFLLGVAAGLTIMALLVMVRGREKDKQPCP